MTTMEGMSTKKKESKTEKKELENEETDITDTTMLTKEEAEKMVKDLMKLNLTKS